MTNKRILLSIPQPILIKLENDKSRRGFTNLQEIIIDVIRDHYFRRTTKSGRKRGRPKDKIDEHKILRGDIVEGKRPTDPIV